MNKFCSVGPGLAFKHTNQLRKFRVGRTWNNALAWKDFYYLAGGKAMMIAKFILYGILIYGLAYVMHFYWISLEPEWQGTWQLLDGNRLDVGLGRTCFLFLADLLRKGQVENIIRHQHAATQHGPNRLLQNRGLLDRLGSFHGVPVTVYQIGCASADGCHLFVVHGCCLSTVGVGSPGGADAFMMAMVFFGSIGIMCL